VIAGNRTCSFDLISRRIMRVTVPADAQAVTTKQKDKDGNDVMVPTAVDIHVVAPYGATARLPVPVVGGCPTTGDPKFTWGLPRIYSANYAVLTDMAGKKTADISKTNLLPANYQLYIDTPNGMLFPGATTLFLTLADGAKIVATSKTAIPAQFDFRTSRFIVLPADALAANNDLTGQLKTYLESNNYPSPLNMTVTGRLVIGSAPQTFVTVESSIQITVKTP
jgi:hypothetical protein